jgi:hypothetical protein
MPALPSERVETRNGASRASFRPAGTGISARFTPGRRTRSVALQPAALLQPGPPGRGRQ